MRLGLVGRIAGVLCTVLGLATACGGHSTRTAGDGETDDGSSDDGSSDDGSSDDGSSGGDGWGGSTAVGGAMPAGGTSYGGVGQGGVPTGGYGGVASMGGVAGSVGVGGASPCPDCPVWEYGLAIEGDGPPFAMDYNGYFGTTDADVCAATPLRGFIGGCGYFDLHACAGPANEPPCLEVLSGIVRYLDGNGLVWSGPITAITSNPSIPGVASGTFAAELSAPDTGNAFRDLHVDFTFCNGLRLLDICR